MKNTTLAIILIAIAACLLIYLKKKQQHPKDTIIEGLTSDEAIQNIASLYNSQQLIANDISSQNITTNTLTATTISGPAADSLGPSCNWTGERKMEGSNGCENDLYIYCTDGKVTNFRFDCPAKD